jgi:hypothetical protein
LSEAQIKEELKKLEEDLKAGKISKADYDKKKEELQKKLELLEES